MEGREWRVGSGGWEVEGGKWRVGNGGWEVEGGGWGMESVRKYVRCGMQQARFTFNMAAENTCQPDHPPTL